MRKGPSESSCRRRLQTTFRCCGQKPWWLAVKAKRLGSKSGQVTPRKRNDSEPPLLMSKTTRRYQNRGLLEARGISSDGTCLRAEWYPAYRWPDPGRGDY